MEEKVDDHTHLGTMVLMVVMLVLGWGLGKSRESYTQRSEFCPAYFAEMSTAADSLRALKEHPGCWDAVRRSKEK